MPACDEFLYETIHVDGHTCQVGIATDPNNDPCERAIKQYTALCLNMYSGRLASSCHVCPAGQDCSPRMRPGDYNNIGNAVKNIADYIKYGMGMEGDPELCKQAAQDAAQINEGEVLICYGYHNGT